MANQNYTVTVQGTDRKQKVDVEAKNPQLAAKMAEVIGEGEAVDVTVTLRIRGRCGRCNGIIFEGEYTRRRGNQIRCSDC